MIPINSTCGGAETEGDIFCEIFYLGWWIVRYYFRANCGKKIIISTRHFFFSLNQKTTSNFLQFLCTCWSYQGVFLDNLRRKVWKKIINMLINSAIYQQKSKVNVIILTSRLTVLHQSKWIFLWKFLCTETKRNSWKRCFWKIEWKMCLFVFLSYHIINSQ